MKTLILNADFTPHDIQPWQKSFVKLYFEPFNIIGVEYYDKVISNTHGEEFLVPAVCALKKYVKKSKIKLSKRNLFIRDGYVCQYCGQTFKPAELTIDHVVSRSKFPKGTHHSWDNLVTACRQCNSYKADRLLSDTGLKLLNKPVEPKFLDIGHWAGEIPVEWENYIRKKT